jgi:hypothetical protein
MSTGFESVTTRESSFGVTLGVILKQAKSSCLQNSSKEPICRVKRHRFNHGFVEVVY